MDALEFISPQFSKFYSSWHTRLYLYLPNIFGMGYRFAENHPGMFRKDAWIYRQFARGTDRLWSYACRHNIDAVISTHVFAALMVTSVRVRHTNWTPWCAFVNTDYTCSPSTGDSRMDCYYIPDETLRQEFVSMGIPEDKIRVSGIPVRKAFYLRQPKEQVRAELNLPPDCRHILMMSGSMGCGPLKPLTRCLAANLRDKEHLTIVCGTNKVLRQSLASRYGTNPKITVLGYADNVSQLMDSADLFLTKPGGLSITEAVAKGLPMVLIQAVAAYEDRNKQYLINRGCAVKEDTVENLSKHCLDLLRDPEALKRMSAACVPANGAEYIVKHTLEDMRNREAGSL